MAYPAWMVRALHAKARELGAEDKPVDEATGEAHEVRAWGMPATAPARTVMKPVVHSELLKVPVRRRYILGTRAFSDAAPADTSRVKVGEWLRSMLPEEEANGLATARENAA